MACPASGGIIPHWWGSRTALLPLRGRGTYRGSKARSVLAAQTRSLTARESLQDAGHVCQVKKRANMSDKNLSQSFRSKVVLFLAFIIWLSVMCVTLLGIHVVVKSILGVYALQDRVDRIEYRLDHMQAE